jgi:predicted permease
VARRIYDSRYSMHLAFWDLRIALRRLRRAPAFMAFSVCSIGIGVAASIAILASVRALFWVPFGSEAAPLIYPLFTHGRLVIPNVSWQDYVDLRREQSGFSFVSATAPLRVPLLIDRASFVVFGEAVSGDYLNMWGLTPALGRLLDATDEGRSNKVAVVSERFWRSRLGADASAVGRTLRVEGEVFEVVGVVKGDFQGLRPFAPTSIWLPITSAASTRGLTPDDILSNRELTSVVVCMRPRQSASLSTASMELESIGQGLDLAFGPRPGTAARAWSLKTSASEVHKAQRTIGFATVVLGVAMAILVVASMNVANLSLARGTARRAETAVQSALGASRFRLMRLFGLESILIGMMGGGLAWIILLLITPYLATEFYLKRGVYLTIVPELDTSMIVAMVTATLTATWISGIWPALRATRRDIKSDMSGGEGRTESQSRVHEYVIAWQVCGSVALVALGVMCVRSVVIQSRHGGGEVEYGRFAVASIDFTLNGQTAARAEDITLNIIEALHRVPGVQTAGATSAFPLDSATALVPISAATAEGNADSRVAVVSITPGLLAPLGVSVRQGRPFLSSDNHPAASPSALIGRGLARTLFRGADPIGRTVKLGTSAFGQPSIFTVVGVFEAAGQSSSVAHSVLVPPRQRHSRAVSIVARSSDGSPPVTLLRNMIRQHDSGVVATFLGSGSELADRRLHIVRHLATLAFVAGFLAVALAMVGLYGVLSNVVASRTREIGIRLALGAAPRQVMGSVMREGMRPVASGVVIGLLLAYIAGAALDATLNLKLNPADWRLFLSLPVPFLAAALCACWLPSARASRVTPSRALRHF